MLPYTFILLASDLSCLLNKNIACSYIRLSRVLLSVQGLFQSNASMWYDKVAAKQVTDLCIRLINVPPGGYSIIMKAEISHVGRCDICKNPASYVQTLGSGRFFRYCDQHVPEGVKRAADRNAQKSGTVTSRAQVNAVTPDQAGENSKAE